MGAVTQYLLHMLIALAWLLVCWYSDEARRRTLNVLTAFDQLAWVVLTLGNGLPDETISAAAWRMESQGKRAGIWLRPLIDALFRPFERDHCRKAYNAEFHKLQLPKSYQTSEE